jgi:hypothetical protein
LAHHGIIIIGLNTIFDTILISGDSAKHDPFDTSENLRISIEESERRGQIIHEGVHCAGFLHIISFVSLSVTSAAAVDGVRSTAFLSITAGETTFALEFDGIDRHC